jgi:hypothetical protein
MYKKNIKYVDYNGVEHQEDFYFNLNKIECTKLQLSTKEGYGEYIKNVVESKDMNAIFDVFNNIILASYGIKSEDGMYFKKSKELSEAFSQSPAYEALFMELATSSEEADKFIKAVMPADLISKLDQK